MKLGTKFLAKDSTLLALWVNQSQHDDIWKRIWGLPVPNKFKNFLWRTCREAILVKRSRWKKKKSSLMMFASIVIYPLRLFAMLYGSVRRSQVWEAILGFEFRQLHNFPWFRDLVLFIQAERKNLELLAMVLWTIWYRRNQLRVVSKDFPISQVVPQASHALSDIKQFNVSPILTGRH